MLIYNITYWSIPGYSANGHITKQCRNVSQCSHCINEGRMIIAESPLNRFRNRENILAIAVASDKQLKNRSTINRKFMPITI